MKRECLPALNRNDIARLLKKGDILQGVDWEPSEYCYYDKTYKTKAEKFRYTHRLDGIDEPMMGVWDIIDWVKLVKSD